MSKGKKKKRSVDLDKKRRETKKLNWLLAVIMVPIFIFIISIRYVYRYSFVNVFLFPLWYVALALGIVAGLLFSIKFVGKEHGFWKRLGAFAIITGITWLGSGSVIAHLNHWFDTSEPIRYEVVIEDRDFDTRNRYSRTKYEFDFILNGETYDVNVPRSDYKNYREGDTYVVEYHEGAFGVPYFMSAGWSKDPPELPPSAQEPIEE